MLVYQRVGFDPSADHLIISVSHCHISVQLQELQGPAFAYELNWVWPRPLEQFRTILVADLLYSHQYKYIHCFWFAYIIIYLYKCVYHIYICRDYIVYDRNLKVYTSISAICGQKRPKSCHSHNDSKCSYVWRTAMRRCVHPVVVPSWRGMHIVRGANISMNMM